MSSRAATQTLASGAARERKDPLSIPGYERAAFPALIGLSFYAACRGLAYAATKRLWFDEIVTQIVSRQADLHGIWSALKNGADGNPPPYYLLARVAAALPFDEHVIYRIPSILAFVFTFICLYVFVRRNDGALRAAICASVLLLTELYTWFAAEARPYALVTACVALALICYQRAPRSSWIFGLSLILTAAVCLHYYAIFAVVPFGAAELALTWKARRARPQVWIALLLSLAPLAVFHGLLSSLKALYAAHAWSLPRLQWKAVMGSYGEFLGIPEPLGLVLALLCVWALCDTLAQKTRPENADDFHEHVLALGFLALPAILLGTAALTHGGALPRYCVFAIFGVALAVRSVLRRLQPRATLAAAALVFTLIAVQEVHFWTSPDRNVLPASAAEPLQSLANSAGHDDLPIVVADPVAYLQIQHYASPAVKHRLVVVVDPGSAVQYIRTDSTDRTLLVLRQLAPLDVEGFSEFAAAHRTFLLYSDRAYFEWLPRRLADESDDLHLLAQQSPGWLYLVNLNSE